jgi:hypothetical protein
MLLATGSELKSPKLADTSAGKYTVIKSGVWLDHISTFQV